MKTDTPLGTRIVEVHNGSSLFTGNAGQGASNLRQFIIEQDLLEAIVAIPEKMFYNTGIGTYLWVLTNKKENRRKGKIQLIDATSFKSPLRKNLGEKNCEVTAEIRKQILDMYMAFDKADNRYSKVFENSEFGYWSITVERPLRLRVYPEREIPETTFKSEKDRIAVREALASLPKDTPLDDWGHLPKKQN
jgi:type I restriction enzyme M protein